MDSRFVCWFKLCLNSLVHPLDLVNMSSSFPADALQAGCKRVEGLRVKGSQWRITWKRKSNMSWTEGLSGII